MNQSRPQGITAIALLMIVFGGAEVVTGFTYDFFGIVAGASAAATYLGMIIGTLYVTSGLRVLH